MVRKYVRKRPSPWRNLDRRMLAAARLRDRGLSLRQAAGELAVSYETIRRDLARWDREHANVVPLTVTPSRHKSPPAGPDVTPECDSAEVISITGRQSS